MIDSEREMKGLGRKHPVNTHNKRSLIQTSHVCHKRRQVKEYKHTHTHIHTHMLAAMKMTSNNLLKWGST